MWAREMEGWRLSKCTNMCRHPATHSCLEKIQPVLLQSWQTTSSSKHTQTAWIDEICTWDPDFEQVLTAPTWQQVKTRITFYDPVSRTAGGGTVWCASTALCMYKVLICSLFTILPTRTDGSLCICTTCQLKWKCVVSRHWVCIRNVPVERETPPERHAWKLESKVRYMNRSKEKGRENIV